MARSRVDLPAAFGPASTVTSPGRSSGRSRNTGQTGPANTRIGMERLRAVLVAPAPRLAVDEVGRELAVLGRHVQDLDPRDALGRPALVDVDVGGGCRDHGAPPGQHRLQAGDVRPGAVEDRERLRVVAEVTDWTRLTPEALQMWRDTLIAKAPTERGEIIN